MSPAAPLFEDERRGDVPGPMFTRQHEGRVKRVETAEIYRVQVNTLLSRDMKTFVKTAACFPHRITEDMRASVMKDFKMSEKVRVV